MKFSKVLTAAVLGVAIAATPANAANIIVNQTLDLTQPKALPGPGFQGWQGSPAFDGGYDVDIAEGDVFDLTIDFLGAQTLTLSNTSLLWAFSFSGAPGSDVTGAGTLSLLDNLGNVLETSFVKTSTENESHFGQIFSASDFASGLAGSRTFSGLRYTGTLDDYGLDGLTTRNYANNAALFLVADSVLVGGGVPEPATWAMMIAGFGLVGAGMRRKRNIPALA